MKSKNDYRTCEKFNNVQECSRMAEPKVLKTLVLETSCTAILEHSWTLRKVQESFLNFKNESWRSIVILEIQEWFLKFKNHSWSSIIILEVQEPFLNFKNDSWSSRIILELQESLLKFTHNLKRFWKINFNDFKQKQQCFQ